MGTRADFYVGAGRKAEWLGSVAYDGYEWERKGSSLLTASSEATFRDVVALILSSRPYSTRPEDGWPWPWETSATTDYVYWWNCGKARVAVFDDKRKWPDMTAHQNVAFGTRSGMTLVTIDANGRLHVE